jgi:hypothetical protein
VLLCQFHHTCVHEGGIMITRNQKESFQGAAVAGEPAWLFTMPDGQRVDQPGWPIPSAARLSYRLARLASVDHVDRLNHPDAARIQPKQYGERFDLHAAVHVLFTLQTPARPPSDLSEMRGRIRSSQHRPSRQC